MKNCELCRFPARTFCESDQASLCWDCDAKVHGANFLVARHSRSLLCHACQSPTPWKASGEKLGHTFSVCVSCVVRDESRDDDDEDDDEDEDEESHAADNDEDDDDDEDEDVDADVDGDNQVVPLSSTTLKTPPPPPSSSSSWSGEEAASAFCNGGRDGGSSSDLRFQEDLDRSSSRKRNRLDGGDTSIDSSRPRKDRRIDLNEPGSPYAPVIESVMRYRRKDIRKISGGSEAVDLDASEPPKPSDTR